MSNTKALLLLLLLVTAACGSGSGAAGSAPGDADLVLAVANDPSSPASARVFRWTGGRLEEANLPPLDESLALDVTWASPTEAWVPILAGGVTRLLRSDDGGRTFAPSGIDLPPELARSSLFHFTADAVWTTGIADVFVGSAGVLPLVTSLWASTDSGTTWQRRWRFEGLGVQLGNLEFARRGGRDEVWYERAGEGGPSLLLDLASGDREPVETPPFVPTRYTAAGDLGFLVGYLPQFPDPDLPAIATARRGETWALDPIPGSPSPPPLLVLVDFVDEQRGVTCGLRREWVDDRSVVRGIGCFVTADGGATWAFFEPLAGGELGVEDLAYTRQGEVLIAARTGVGAPGEGRAVLLVGRPDGGAFREYPLAGWVGARLARSSAAPAR